MIQFSVDPGVHYCGWAQWKSHRLTAVGIAQVYVDDGRPGVPMTLHQEMRRFRGQPVAIEGQFSAPGQRFANVIGLAHTAGIVAGLASEFTIIRPYDWKGNVDKLITMRRVWSACSQAERKLLNEWAARTRHPQMGAEYTLQSKTSHWNDVLAAVGLGRVHTKKYG